MVNWALSRDLSCSPQPDWSHHLMPEPGTLSDRAVTTAARSMELLEDGDLKHLPSHLLLQVLTKVLMTDKSLSLHDWRTTQKFVRREPGLLQKFGIEFFSKSLRIPRSERPLFSYVKPLVSSSFDFLVQLSLTDGAAFETNDLLCLTQLKNLGVLQIIQPGADERASVFPRVTDSILRVWAEQQDAFPVLRILRIWGNHFTTYKSLPFVSKFPALRIYDVAGLSRDWAMGEAPLRWSLYRNTWPKHAFGRDSHTLRWDTHPMGMLAQHLHLLGAPYLSHFIRNDDEMTDMEWKWILIEHLVSGVLSLEAVPQPTSRGKVAKTKDPGVLFNAKPDRERLSSLVNEEDFRHAWGLILYSQIGEMTKNDDLIRQGVKIGDEGHTIRKLMLPPVPLVTLSLGHEVSFSLRQKTTSLPIHASNKSTSSSLLRDVRPNNHVPQIRSHPSPTQPGRESAVIPRSRSPTARGGKAIFDTQCTFTRIGVSELAVNAETVPNKKRPTSGSGAKRPKKRVDVNAIIDTFL
ncbi:hypothetical protein F5Y15DRAFT_131943 [Xylariaceae sp. FL0016]|nr:hypothetical protein F5Y15DRAFT_131943 [Xylariaceae sp. FL0016]